MGGPRCTCWPLQCLVWERDPSPPSWAVRLESTLPSQGRPWSGRGMTLGISPPCPALPSSPSLQLGAWKPRMLADALLFPGSPRSWGQSSHVSHCLPHRL